MIKSPHHAVFRHDKSREEVRKFFEDFGFTVSHESDDRIFFRGLLERPYIYVAELGKPVGLVSVGYEVRSREALEHFSRHFGKPIEPMDNLWGGVRVRIADPDGNVIDLVWGIQELKRLPFTRPAIRPNAGGEVKRLGPLPKLGYGPTPLLFLCHVVQNTPNPDALIDWYGEHLGTVPSDYMTKPDGSTMGAFMRFPHGDDYVDHHNIAVFEGPLRTVQHTGFEALDYDSVRTGHEYLRDKGHKLAWGPLRHSIGGAVSDYWVDISGFYVEHATDGDVVDHTYPTRRNPMNRDTLLQWGPDMPADF